MPGRLIPRLGRRVWSGVAVGLLVVAGTVLWTERPHLAGNAPVAAPLVYTVAAGEAARLVVLTDGSRVLLAPGSTLRSRGRFGTAAARELDFAGEAQFTVNDGDDPRAAPFVVHGAGVRVDNAGSVFVLRTVSGRLLVSVTEGEVRLGRGEAVVREGEASLVDSGGVMTALPGDAARGSLAWTSGALLFRDETLEAVAERLRRWTGREITVDPLLAPRRLTVAFERRSPDEMLGEVAALAGARVEHYGNTWALQMR